MAGVTRHRALRRLVGVPLEAEIDQHRWRGVRVLGAGDGEPITELQVRLVPCAALMLLEAEENDVGVGETRAERLLEPAGHAEALTGREQARGVGDGVALEAPEETVGQERVLEHLERALQHRVHAEAVHEAEQLDAARRQGFRERGRRAGRATTPAERGGRRQRLAAEGAMAPLVVAHRVRQDRGQPLGRRRAHHHAVGDLHDGLGGRRILAGLGAEGQHDLRAVGGQLERVGMVGRRVGGVPPRLRLRALRRPRIRHSTLTPPDARWPIQRRVSSAGSATHGIPDAGRDVRLCLHARLDAGHGQAVAGRVVVDPAHDELGLGCGDRIFAGVAPGDERRPHLGPVPGAAGE